MPDDLTLAQPPLFLNDTGTWVPSLPEDQIPQAVATGAASFAAGARIPVISPAGIRGTVPAEKAQDAFASGFRYEPIASQRQAAIEAKYGSPGQVAKTVAENALGSASLGLAPYLQTKLEISTPEDMRLRAETNPRAELAGDVLGAVAGLAIPGAPVKVAGQLADRAALGVAKTMGIAAQHATVPARSATEFASALGSRLKDFGTRAMANPEAALGEVGAGLSSAWRSTLAPSVLAGKAAARGTGGALEAALWQSGQLLEEDARNGPEVSLMAESAFSDLFSAAILGGSLGAMSGVILPKIRAGKLPPLPKDTPGLWSVLDVGSDIAGGLGGISMIAGGLPAGPAGALLGGLAVKFAADGWKAFPRAVAIVNKFGDVRIKAGRQIGTGVKALLAGTTVQGLGLRKAIQAQQAREEYEERIQYINYLMNNPSAFESVLTRELGGYGDYLPNTALALNTTSTRAISFLAGQIPVVPELGPLSPRHTPSNAEMALFNSVWRAVENPLSILDDAARGSLDPQAVGAVATVYPSLYGEIERQLLEGVTDSKTPPPYRARQSISMLLKQDLDGSQSPQAVQMVQSAYGPVENLGVQKPLPKPRARPGQISKMKLADRTQTPVQRLSNK